MAHKKGMGSSKNGRDSNAKRLGVKVSDGQSILAGGIILHQGKIAEMRTGEGKTITIALAAYLNALSGKGVHVVTVNDYLAKRDCENMSKIYNFLGLSAGYICLLYTSPSPRDRG